MLIQCAGDGLHAAAADIGRENQSDGFGCFLHNDNLLRVFILEIAERRDGHDSFLLLLTIACADTAAAVACVEIVDKTLEADDEIVVFIECIDVLRCGKHSDIMLPQIVDEQRCLRPMTTKARQILDNDRFNFPCFNRLVDFIDALAVEVHTADIVIEGLAHNLVTVCDGIFINDFSLICQGIQFIILVAAQAII